jgi:hypothetical protein
MLTIHFPAAKTGNQSKSPQIFVKYSGYFPQISSDFVSIACFFAAKLRKMKYQQARGKTKQ